MRVAQPIVGRHVMSMRNRQGMILDRFDPNLDPGSLCVPMGKPKAPPICHCQPAQSGRLGGMVPAIDRERSRVVCRSCLKEIGPGCRRRQVVHLRGLIALDQKHPEHVDWDDVEDAGWLL